MKTYTFMIGDKDDFQSAEELLEHFEGGGGTYICNCSSFEFEAPRDADLSTVQLIGFGLAFLNGWSQDGTHYFFIEGVLDGQAEKEMFNAGEAARLGMEQ